MLYGRQRLGWFGVYSDDKNIAPDHTYLPSCMKSKTPRQVSYNSRQYAVNALWLVQKEVFIGGKGKKEKFASWLFPVDFCINQNPITTFQSY